MIQSFIIKNDKELKVNKVEENSTLFIFIDCYMTTKIKDFLVELSKKGNIEVFMKNIGKVVEKSSSIEQKEIIENYYTGDISLEVYRKYTLMYPSTDKYIDANVAILSDEIQYVTFENTTNLLYVNELTIDNILKMEVDLFLFITTWDGLYKEFGEIPRQDRVLLFEEYINKFKEKGIPIAFYSKEDPPNYAAFKDLAIKADIIFTSSAEKISEYKKINSAAKISNLTYGINPSNQSPILPSNEKNEVMFAGTWFNGKYIDRMNATKELFEYIEANNLRFTFYNRNYYRDIPLFKLPEKYEKYEKPALPYNELLDKYKEYKYHINLNSVINDQTMFAVRVLELQGLGKKLISNYSLPIYIDYPNISIFNGTVNKEFPIEDKILGVRNTFKKNSVFDFWKKLFTDANLSYLLPLEDELIYDANLTELQRKDIRISTKYSNVEFYKITTDPDKYYTVKKYNKEAYHAKRKNSNNGILLYLPESKYYSYSKKLLVVSVHDYKEALKLEANEYIVLFEDNIKNSQFINRQFKKAGFTLIKEFELRERIFPKQNMAALSLINLLHYTEKLDVVKVYNGKATTIGRMAKDSLVFEQLVSDYKASVQRKESMKLDIDLLLFDLNIGVTDEK